MSRALLILANEEVRKRAHAWVAKAPIGYRIEFKEPKRSLEQNDYMWALLSDVAGQMLLRGKKYNTGQWKCIFMQSLGHQVDFLPTYEGDGFFPTGLKSSDLGKKEMSELIDFIIAEGIQNGVKFHDLKDVAA